MSKSRASAPIQAPPTNSMISTQSAIYLLNTRLQKIEGVMKLHMDDIERKFGEQETYVSDNIPDLDLINKAISDVNTRLLDFESRISLLENAGSASRSPPALSPPPAQPAKKKGTVKLSDITPTPTIDQPGISFSN